MAAKATYSILDHSNEVSTVSFWLPELTAGNYDDVVGDSAGDHVGDIRLAMNPLILGNHLRRTVTAVVHQDTATLPTDANAQRERKARFTYRDVVLGRAGSFEIPTANASILVNQGSDVIDLEQVLVAAFIAAVEARAVSEFGNAIEITGGRLVGRAI